MLKKNLITAEKYNTGKMYLSGHFPPKKKENPENDFPWLL